MNIEKITTLVNANSRINEICTDFNTLLELNKKNVLINTYDIFVNLREQLLLNVFQFNDLKDFFKAINQMNYLSNGYNKISLCESIMTMSTNMDMNYTMRNTGLYSHTHILEFIINENLCDENKKDYRNNTYRPRIFETSFKGIEYTIKVENYLINEDNEVYTLSVNDEIIINNNKPFITEQVFLSCTGEKPIQDDLKRCNCDKAGQMNHLQCGWNYERNKPVFMVGN